MRHVAAYLLAVLGGNANPSANDLKGILSAVGVDASNASLEIVINNLKGKSLNDLIEEGNTLLANVPSGGPGGASLSNGGTAAATEEEMPKEKNPEPDSDGSSDSEMGFGLFD